MPVGSSLRGLRALKPVPFVVAGKGMYPVFGDEREKP